MPPPRRKKKSKGGSSGSIPSVANKQTPMSPKMMGIIGGVVVLAIVGYVAVQQLNDHQAAVQNAVNEPIRADRPSNPAPGGQAPSNLPTALPSDHEAAARLADVNPSSPSMPGSLDSSTKTISPSEPVVGKPKVKGSMNPLVALIKGDVSLPPIPGLGGPGGGPSDATLFITLEDGQHIPVTSQEHQAYTRGELHREQIEQMIVRARNFSIDNPKFERFGSPSNGMSGSLLASNFDVRSVGSFLAKVSVKKLDGRVVTTTGCLIHPDGGLVVPASALQDGVDLTVSFQNQTFRTADIIVGMTDPATRLTLLRLPTQGEKVPVIPLSAPPSAPVVSPISASQVNFDGGKMERIAVKAQPISFQILSGENSLLIPGNWLEIEGSTLPVGQPVFDGEGALLAYTISKALSDPQKMIAVSSNSLQSLIGGSPVSFDSSNSSEMSNEPGSRIALPLNGVDSAPMSFDSGPGSGGAAGPSSDVATQKVQELFFAPSIAETNTGRELLTNIRWIQMGTLVKMNTGATPPSSMLGRLMSALARQSLDKTDVNLATPDRENQAAILMCVIDYNAPVLAPDGQRTDGLPTVAQDIDMVFRLLVFAKDPSDASGQTYVRVLEVDPMTMRVPASFQEQGVASRYMKEQITNMYNKFHSGIRKARRDLGRL